MAKNSSLQDAKKAKFDEFYTLEQPIRDELYNYTEDRDDIGIHNQFKGKVVFCNCDDPEWSNFWKYFIKNFERIGIRKVISTHYEKDGNPSYKMEYDGTKDYDGNPVFKKTPLDGNGDFRSEECIAILDKTDIVVTNPPFSIFREYINTLISHKKQFVILGNMNNITYKDVFPHIKEGRLRLGVHSGSMEFRVPDNFERNNVYSKDGVKYARFGNICWYTNLEHFKMHEFLELNDTYKGNEENYPKYDNYDAIEVGRIGKIPDDYYEPMGVPITILQHFNSEQFMILGNLGSYAVDGYSLSPAIYVNNKKIFKRILIQRVSNSKKEVKNMYRPSKYKLSQESLESFAERFNECPACKNLECCSIKEETYDNDGYFIDAGTGKTMGFDWEIRDKYFKTAYSSLRLLVNLRENCQNPQ